MFWLIRKFIKIIIIMAILGLLAGSLFVYFMDPNNYKKQINQSLQDYLGLPLKVNGSVEWSLKPKAMIHLQNISMNKPGDDKTLVLEIKDANMHFDLFSYFKHDLIINDLQLTDVNLDTTQLKQLTESPITHKCLIQKLSVKNISLNIDNPSDHMNWQLKNAILTAKNIIISHGKELPVINLTGDLINVGKHATLKLDTAVAFTPSKHSLTLDPLKIVWNSTPFQGHAEIQQYDTDPVINGSIIMDTTDVGDVLKKIDPYYTNNDQSQPLAHNMRAQIDYSFASKEDILDFSNIHFQMDSGAIDGNIKMSLVSPYRAEFNLTSDNIDFVPLSLLGKALFPTLPSQTLIPVEFIKNLTLNGKFTGTNLRFNSIQLDQLTLAVMGQNGIMQFAPLTVVAYGGTHNITLNLDVINKQQPFIQLTEQANNIALEPLLKIVHETGIINGTANIKTSLEAMGNNFDAIKQTMTGAINISVSDGTLYGFNADKLMSFTTQTVNDIFNEVSKSPSIDVRSLAIKKASGWISTQQDAPKTAFSHFDLKADIEQGVSKKASIAMDNNIIELKATGGFNLNDNTLNMNATIVNKSDITTDVKSISSYIQKTPLELLITGTIQKPLYGPNIQGFAVNIVQLAQTDMLNQAISKMVAATPPNAKTSKTATDLFLDSLQSLRK